MTTKVIYQSLALAFLQLVFVANSFAKRNELSVNYIKNDISCFGLSNGSIDINVSGGKAPYTIQWSHGETVTSLKNLKQGTYYVVVTDAKNVKTSEKIEINMPSPLSVNYSSKEEFILDGYSASLDIKIGGGSPWTNNDQEAYIVKINDNYSMPENAEMKDGVYKLSVEDQQGCKLAFNVFLNVKTETPTGSYFESIEADQPKTNSPLGIVNMSIYESKNSFSNTASTFSSNM